MLHVPKQRFTWASRMGCHFDLIIGIERRTAMEFERNGNGPLLAILTMGRGTVVNLPNMRILLHYYVYEKYMY